MVPPSELPPGLNPPERAGDRYVRVEAKVVFLVGPLKDGVAVEHAITEVREMLAFASNRDDVQGVRHLDITPPEDEAAYTAANAWGDPYGTEY